MKLENIHQIISNSFIGQYSNLVRDTGRFNIKGIFFCFNSISAITVGSITSSGTSMNGFKPLANCTALKPIIFVFSYFVSKGIVL